MTTGIFIGKFFPPHRGHLTSILTAYTMCDQLYVIICHRPEYEISWQLRKQWLSQELQNFENVKIVVVDENNIPVYPSGWNEFCNLVRKSIPGQIDFVFGGEIQDAAEYEKRLNAKYILLHPNHSAWPICGEEIRKNPYKHWDYIVGSARPYFIHKVLITGTESCGKTTLTKMLAKIYNTSWSEEVGRYYAKDYLGGDESIFTDEDFARIAHLQYESDYHAMRTANKICFFDTDAVVTNYYSKLYMGHKNKRVESFIKKDNYDLIIIMSPSVKWVNDGQRLNGDDEKRWKLHDYLCKEYSKIYNELDTYYITDDNYANRLFNIQKILKQRLTWKWA